MESTVRDIFERVWTVFCR
ncbi:hypothetical protein LINPERPRIM_LOCUS38301 [Linum perenne]